MTSPFTPPKGALGERYQFLSPADSGAGGAAATIHSSSAVVALDSSSQGLPSHSIALAGNLEAQQPLLTARFAQPKDAELLAEIAALVNIHNYAQFDRGFLFYSLSEAEYRIRIERGDICYLLECDGVSIGFIVGVPSLHIRKELSESEQPNHLFQIIDDYATKHAITEYLFVDQAAILPEYQNRGFGERHFENLAARLSGPYFCDILEAPLRNPRVRYWVKRGFRKIGEVVEQAPERFLRAESSFTKSDRLTWGVYFLENGGWRVTNGMKEGAKLGF